jgi:hypothetical protein
MLWTMQDEKTARALDFRGRGRPLPAGAKHRYLIRNGDFKGPSAPFCDSQAIIDSHPNQDVLQTTTMTMAAPDRGCGPTTATKHTK